MHGGQDGDWLFGDVNTCKNLGTLGNARQPFVQNYWIEMFEV